MDFLASDRPEFKFAASVLARSVARPTAEEHGDTELNFLHWSLTLWREGSITKCTICGVTVIRAATVSCTYSALHYQQEQLENAAHEHQWVAYEEVQTAAALATSRTAAQTTSRFRDLEKNAEANFSQQQRGLLSEFMSESAQALEAQRHSLIHEAGAEMMRRVVNMPIVNPTNFNNLRQN